MTFKTKLILTLIATFLVSATSSALITIALNNPPNHSVSKQPSPSPSPLPGAVLPAQILLTPSPTTPPSIQEPTLRSYLHGQITIAFLGDTIIANLNQFDQLNQLLKQTYPNVDFKLINLSSRNANLQDAGNQLANLLQTDKPDLVIVESFAYSLAISHQLDLQAQSLHLQQIFDQLASQRILSALLTPIAPNKANFGSNDLNLTAETKASQVTAIKDLVVNAVNLARTNKITVIDAYTPSITSPNGGDLSLIDPSDGIHPSFDGLVFIADIIAKNIIQNNIIEQIISSKTH